MPSIAPITSPPPNGTRIASLVPQETSDRALPRPNRSQQRLFGSGGVAEWAQVVEALATSAVPGMCRRAAKIRECCAGPQVAVGADGLPRLVLYMCRDRICPGCAKVRAAHLAKRVNTALHEADAVRFITLTQRSKDESLRTSIDRLLAAFRRLRRCDHWRRRVDGGVYTIEATFNARAKTWHVHLHVLADGGYYAQDQLQDDWSEAVGDRSIADIRLANSRAGAAKYVSKYAAKAASLRELKPAQIRDYAHALAGRRLVSSFGSLHGKMPTATPLERTDQVTQTHSVRRIRDAVEAGDRRAIAATSVLAALGGSWARLFRAPEWPHATDQAKPTDAELRDAADQLAEVERDRKLRDELPPPPGRDGSAPTAVPGA